ncbi:MAG TPA: ribonuclease HI [bacterium]|nr:ribonuclease HI [bacterium]HPN32438.1 ribonuclease HI [bacterium]
MFCVDLYTDGACSGNPGPGGYAYLLRCAGKIKKHSAGYFNTTNNRMELRGAIEGLKCLKKKCEVTVYTDSQYIARAFNDKWLVKWKMLNWKKKINGEYIKNMDLWKELDALTQKHIVKFFWVKGHSDNPFNNECDKMAVAASQSAHKIEDAGFPEKKIKPDDGLFDGAV